MYCDACGAELQLGQKFCNNCGKPLGMAVVPRPAGNRVAQHVHLLGILWIIGSVLVLVGGLVLLVVGNTLFSQAGNVTGEPYSHVGFLRPLLTVIGVFVLAKGVVGMAAGLGLLQRLAWARVLALIVGFISLLNIPFGTALGVYTLWVLLSPNAEEDYRSLAQAA
jgi:zinc-ribbon domain